MTKPKPRKIVVKKVVNVKTARDQTVADTKANADNQKVAVDKLTLDDRITALTKDIATSDTAIATLTKQVDTAKKSANPNSYQPIQVLLDAEKSKHGSLIDQRTALTLQQKINKDVEAQTATLFAKAASTGVTESSSTAAGSIQRTGTLPLNYNAGTVDEAYFSGRSSFLSEMKITGNKPSAVTQATELWNTAKTSKGMIVTAATTLKAWQSSSNNDNHNYGFQFMYNPGTVSMTYYTAPNVDVALQASGQELFNLSGVAGSQGSVSFQLVINRTFDMQYFTPAGTPRGDWSSHYNGKKPTEADMSQIWNKGTMYDIEFLLRTLMGTTMSSYLRGVDTADMGWLPAIPVELHMGKTLRYLGTVNNIDITHVIFNENMVPIFSTVNIGFARLPDYPPIASGVI